MSRLRFVGVASLALGLVLAVVATPLHCWSYTVDKQGATICAGLWQKCIEETCYPWSDVNRTVGYTEDLPWLRACEATMVFGVILNIAALASALYATIKLLEIDKPRAAGNFCAILYAATVMMFVFTVFHDMTTGHTLYVGFGLAVAAVVTNVVGAWLIGVYRSPDGYHDV